MYFSETVISIIHSQILTKKEILKYYTSPPMEDFTANMILKCGAWVSSYKSKETYVVVEDVCKESSSRKFKMSVLEASTLNDAHTCFTDIGLLGTWKYDSEEDRIKLLKYESSDEPEKVKDFLLSKSSCEIIRNDYAAFFSKHK